jgi:hypothetical protein
MDAFRDVVVLLPGITGSVLASARGEEVWSPSVGAIWRAITSAGKTISGLELSKDGDPGEVVATRLMPDASIIPGFIKIDGYTRIENYLTRHLGLTKGKNYFPFPYDWRLDNRANAKRLEDMAMNWLREWRVASGASNARLVLIGHSMGGLIARYFLECLGGYQHARTLVTLGTPHQGALNALNFLANGMKKGIGPLGLDLSPLLRSCMSVYQLLPIYRCITIGEGTLKFVAEATESNDLANINSGRARQAREFHREIEDSQQRNAREDAYSKSGYRLVPLVGIEQPTFQSAHIANGRVEMRCELNGRDDGGDGTVPRGSAVPIELEGRSSAIYAAETHGCLQNNDGALANLKGVLTEEPEGYLSRYRHAEMPPALTLEMDDVVLPGEPLTVRARAEEGNPRIEVELTNIMTGESTTQSLSRGSEAGWRQDDFDLTPGTWRVRAHVDRGSSVSDLAIVVQP